MTTRRRPLFGVGINDADYLVRETVNNVDFICPFYARWADMIKRCYSEKHHKVNPTYFHCSVIPEWLYFMNFRSWMIEQDWEGNELDKDLLVKGNNVYSPDTCIFISHAVNSFMVEKVLRGKGNYPTGVCYHKGANKYMAYGTRLGKSQQYLGLYETPEEAYDVYKAFKTETAIKLASQQTDKRISEALLERYV